MTAHPAAVAAADWWTEKVTGAPSRRAVDASSSPAERESMDLAAALSYIALPKQPSNDRAEKFRELLTAYVDGQLARDLSWLSLGTDYGPDYALGQIADKAGIGFGRFPWKTHMSIRPDHVTAAEGYRSESRIVWHADDWQRPECGSQDWGDAGPKGTVCRLPMYHESDHAYEVTDAKCSECNGGLKGHDYSAKGHSFKVGEQS